MKILLIDLLYIGDLLFTSAAVRMLRAAHPDAQIDMMVFQFSQDVIRYNPHLDNVIAVDKWGKDNHLGSWLRLIGRMRRERYDWVINLHCIERTSLLAVLSGAKRISGVAKPGFRRFFHQVVSERLDLHPVESYMEMLAELGVPRTEHPRLEMRVDDASQAHADALWREAGLEGNARVIGLNPGASVPSKKWTVEGFAALCEQLTSAGFIPALFGGPMDKERVDAIIARTSASPVVFTGKVNLLQLAALVRKCAVVVSGDSGPMHITASQGVPVVAMFGPTKAWRFYPYGVPHRILQADLPCLDCGRTECEDNRCMRDIQPDRVLQAVESLLAEPVQPI